MSEEIFNANLPGSGKTVLSEGALGTFVVFDEDNGKPDFVAGGEFEDFCCSANWQGRKVSVVDVTTLGCDLHTDLGGTHQIGQCVDPLLGAGVPNNDLGIAGIEHAAITSEPGHINGEILKGGVVATANADQDLVLHLGEGGEKKAEGQDGKEVLPIDQYPEYRTITDRYGDAPSEGHWKRAKWVAPVGYRDRLIIAALIGLAMAAAVLAVRCMGKAFGM